MLKRTLNFMKTGRRRGAIALLVMLTSFVGFSQTELISNGDIEGTIGWEIWTYSNTVPVGTSQPSQYAIVSNPQEFNSVFINTTAHSGSKMLVFDSMLTGGQQHFWGIQVCGLSNKVEHTFKFWSRSLSAGPVADIEMIITNNSGQNSFNLQQIKGTKQAPAFVDGWQEYIYTFTPTEGCAQIRLRHTNSNNYPDSVGRDFALDDFSLTAPPAPLSIEFYANPVSCPQNTDGSIEASAFGGTPPYIYTLSGASTQTNATGVFTSLSAGDYVVQVQDGLGATAATSNISLQSPADITLSPSTTICEGQNTTLTVSGGSSAYTWTSQPVDTSIIDPSLDTQIVNPTETTIYTVETTVVSDSSSGTNLIVNGDFSAGDTGFSTDYIFTADNTAAKAQKMYGIVSNPNTWEPDFSNCSDRSASDNLMFIADGSITSTGNERVWNQTITNLKTNTDYIFSYWVQSVAALSPAQLESQINTVAIGIATAPATACGWIRVFYRWNSGASTTAELTLINRNTAGPGNDFALDEMSFSEAIICNISKQVTVTVNPILTPTFSFTTTYNVADTPDTLPLTSDNGVQGTWNPSTIDTSVPSSTTFTFTPTVASECGISVDRVIIVSNIDPIFTLPLSICSGDSVTLPLISDNLINGFWTPSVIDNTQNGVYLFTPDAGQSANTFTYNLTVNPIVTVTFPVFTTTYCQNDTADILPNPNETITGTWLPAVISTTTPGVIDYVFTPDANQCTSNIPSFRVTINPIITGIEITGGCENDLYIVNALPIANSFDPAAVTYSWTDSNNTVIGNATSKLNVSEVSLASFPATINVTITNSFGCSTTESYVVASNFCLIPKGLSPNGDSKNDTFDLIGLNPKRVQIFNRYGVAIFEKSNYTDQWKGQSSNGNELPSGTYYYVIELQDGQTKTGWVYLAR